MKLKPTERLKKRYILFKIESKTRFSLSDAQKAVNKALKEFLGDFGLFKAAPLFLKEKYIFPYFIIKVNHKYTDHIKAALALSKTIKNESAIMQSITTSGTLKKTCLEIKEEIKNE